MREGLYANSIYHTHIGVDIGKHEIVAACAEGPFGVRKIRNQRGA